MVNAPRPLVFVVGDSISLDYGPSLAQGIAHCAAYDRKSGEDAARLNLDEAAGANGGDSARVLAYLRAQAQATDFRPDLLLVNAGLHDIKRRIDDRSLQVTEDDYAANLRDLCTLAARCRWRLLWVRSTPVLDAVHNQRPGIAFHRHATDLAAYNARADQIMADHGVPSADLHGFTAAQGGPEIFRDHVHYQPSIAQAQGTWLAGVVATHLALGTD